MLKSAVTAAILLACIVTAEARPRHMTGLAQGCNVLWPCESPSASSPQAARETRGRFIARSMGFGAPVLKRAGRVREGREGAIVAHPEGCPFRAFCGCGAAVRVFGQPIRSLWLAANWFKFPRTAPSAGMVAVRNHHVMVLEADLGGGVWRVFDANSGNHLTRIHARSIAGYVVVNPHGAG